MSSPLLPSSASTNGIVTYTRIIAAALRESGHRVSVFHGGAIEHHDGRIEQLATDPGRLGRIAGALRQRLSSRATQRALALTRTIDRIHADDPIDIIEMEESFGTAGRLDTDIPVVARLHGPHVFGRDIPEPAAAQRASEARIAAERAAIVNAAGVTCPSSRMMAATLAHYGVSPSQAVAIGNPVPIVAEGERWSIERCDPDQLLFVGRFDRRKGADVMLEAFAIALASRPALSLVMCGPDIGIADDRGVLRPYRAYAEELLPADVLDRIRFLGPVEPPVIDRLRRASALAVSTSRFEVLAYSVTEAMAAGMAVLVSDTFGASELIADGHDGYVAPVGDATAVAGAILGALEDRARLAEVAARGRLLAERLLAPRAIAEQTLAFYQSVLRRPPARGRPLFTLS